MFPGDLRSFLFFFNCHYARVLRKWDSAGPLTMLTPWLVHIHFMQTQNAAFLGVSLAIRLFPLCSIFSQSIHNLQSSSSQIRAAVSRRSDSCDVWRIPPVRQKTAVIIPTALNITQHADNGFTVFSPRPPAFISCDRHLCNWARLIALSASQCTAPGLQSEAEQQRRLLRNDGTLITHKHLTASPAQSFLVLGTTDPSWQPLPAPPQISTWVISSWIKLQIK